MASIKAFKKDVNTEIATLIDAIYEIELTHPEVDLKKTDALIDEAITAFDTLIAEVNAAKRNKSKDGFKALKEKYTKTLTGLHAKLNKLA
jgi:hypothetical protein